MIWGYHYFRKHPYIYIEREREQCQTDDLDLIKKWHGQHLISCQHKLGELPRMVPTFSKPLITESGLYLSNEVGSCQPDQTYDHQNPHGISCRENGRIKNSTKILCQFTKLYQHRPQIAKNSVCVINVPKKPPQSIAHYNGTLHWHPAMAPRPLGRHPPPQP